MKNLFKKLLKITFICFLFLLIGCEKDLYNETLYHNSKEMKIKEVTFEEFSFKLNQFKNKPKIEGMLSSFKDNGYQARENVSDVIIFIDRIKEITQGSYISYTMYMKTPETKNDTFFNITIENKERPANVFITKYHTTNNWFQNPKQGFEGDISTYRIAGSFSSTAQLEQYIEDAVNSEDLWINNNTTIYVGGGGYTINPFPYCNGQVITTTTYIPYPCGCGHWPWQAALCNGCPSAQPYWWGYSETTSFECIPNYNTDPPTGNNNGGNTAGGGGGTSNNGGTTSPPDNSSITTIVENPTNDCLPIVGDLNGDCTLDYNEAQFQIFHDDLSEEQKQIIDIRKNTLMFFDYLVENNFSEADKQLVKDIIDLMISDPQTFTSIKPFVIEKKIDDSQLDDCTKGILNKLKQNHTIAKLIARFDNPDTAYEISFTQEVIPPNPENPSSVTFGLTTPVVGHPFKYNIKLNSDYFNNSGPTNLFKAKTIIHEMIHALILSIIDSRYFPNGNTDPTDFPEIWDNYIAGKFNGEVNAEHHLFMANNYVTIISQALKEYYINSSNLSDQDIDQMSSDLAWSGLTKIAAIDSFLTPEEKARIANRILTEVIKSNTYGLPLSSNNPCAN